MSLLLFSPSSLLSVSPPPDIISFLSWYLVLALSVRFMLVKTSMVSIVVVYLWLSTLDWSQKQKNTQPTATEPTQQSWSFTVLCLVCSRSSSLTLHLLHTVNLSQSCQDHTNHWVLGHIMLDLHQLRIIVWREPKVRSEDLAIPVETLPSCSMVIMCTMHILYIHICAKENYFYPVECHINLIMLRMDGWFLN